MRWKRDRIESRFCSNVTRPRCCAFFKMLHESLCKFQKMRKRHSSGSTLPCILFGKGAFNIFVRLGSWQMYAHPLSLTC